MEGRFAPILPLEYRNSVKEEKPKKLCVDTRKRIDHFGQLVIDRNIQYDPLWSPFEPKCFLKPVPITKINNEKAAIKSFTKSIVFKR